MTSPAPLPLADLRGLVRLGFGATGGLVDLVEQMHRTIGDVALPLAAARPTRTKGITGLVYGTVRGVTRLVGRAVDVSMQRFETETPGHALSERREALRAAVNGLWGDRLAADGNPLAIPMTLRRGGRPVEPTREGLHDAGLAAGPRVAVLVHGLCMNDLQWRRAGHDHGEMLERELGYTVLALHYNSGLPVAENGARLAALLDTLAAAWPVPIETLALVGHSMGGLVARSACRQAEASGAAWRARLTHLACLGTPHRGAPLERGVHGLDRVLGLSPYVAPFARLGGVRSAGIRDLRDGRIGPDDAVAQPLPARVKVGLLAATTAAAPRGLRHAVIGDGLVTVASAWGEARGATPGWALPAARRRLVTDADHWDLLSHPGAAQALRDWLA